MKNSDDTVVVNGTRIACILGDIVRQTDVDAVVNAANAQLLTGGGVAGAIHRAAGPQLAEECRPLAPIAPGEAVVTGAGKLPNRYVIHTLGPVYGRDEPAAELLAACYATSLRRAEELQLASVAFPALSTGVFGYPMGEAAEVAMQSIAEVLPELVTLTMIRFVLVDERALDIHLDALHRRFGEG
jgi:O-acetyl-ADP-ribose deacetylase (regulator of RNase III)